MFVFIYAGLDTDGTVRLFKTDDRGHVIRMRQIDWIRVFDDLGAEEGDMMLLVSLRRRNTEQKLIDQFDLS